MTSLALHHIHSVQRLYVGLLTKSQIIQLDTIKDHTLNNPLIKIVMSSDINMVNEVAEICGTSNNVKDHQLYDIFQLGKILVQLLASKQEKEQAISDEL